MPGRLADRAPANEIDDREQDDRAKERPKNVGQVQRVRIDGAAADDQAGDNGANDADNDIHQDTLLGVSAHDEAGEPTDNTADDDPNDETHERFPPVR